MAKLKPLKLRVLIQVNEGAMNVMSEFEVTPKLSQLCTPGDGCLSAEGRLHHDIDVKHLASVLRAAADEVERNG